MTAHNFQHSVSRCLFLIPTYITTDRSGCNFFETHRCVRGSENEGGCSKSQPKYTYRPMWVIMAWKWFSSIKSQSWYLSAHQDMPSLVSSSFLFFFKWRGWEDMFGVINSWTDFAKRYIALASNILLFRLFSFSLPTIENNFSHVRDGVPAPVIYPSFSL